MTKNIKKSLIFIFALLLTTAGMAATIKGKVIDKLTKEPLTGTTIQIAGTTLGAIADVDGNYNLPVKQGIYTLEIRYVGYKNIRQANVKVDGTELTLDFEMENDTQVLGEVSVVGQKKRNTENALISEQRQSLVVQSGVSAQQITKTQDKDASEVIKRVPGVSIIDEKFVMVRGLSQRYNNVWINGSAVPSSEPDSRAFSFDIIPSSQLDNMVIVKSPAPEYPADFTGGFIMVNTKDMPSENSFNISLGTSINDQTHFKDFIYNQGSSTDFLGFDNGLRSLDGGIKSTMNTFPNNSNRIDLLNNGLNNDWTVKTKKPVGDLKLNVNYAHRWETESGRQFGVLASLNYSNTYKTYLNMENSLFGSYDAVNDHSVYLRRSTDNQYNNDVRVGALLNFMYQPKNSHNHYEFKNIFNQIGKNRYTSRYGKDAQSNNEKTYEYYYSSRSTYNGQFTGKHTFEDSKLDWSAGYSYANRLLPDRRRYILNDNDEPGTIALTAGNDISREFTRLDEHVGSANVNYQRDLQFGDFTPTLKAGAYGEYRTRTYNTRLFLYSWGNSMPNGFKNFDLPTQLMIDNNYGEDKLFMYEQVQKRNDYSGNNLLGAGYISANLPISSRIDLYAGIRYEYTKLEMIGNTRDDVESHRSMFYKYNDLFPSVNATYKLTDKQQFRLAYGKSVNRPEFRELSTSVYYDFDLGSNVEGDPSLKPSYIHNIDFRYEWYPSNGESVSVALFYKHFDSPIEWTYTVAGGTDLVYSNKNAKAANNYGVEVDLRKNLDFIGLPNFSWSFNGSLIKSKVKFEKGSKEEDRPMQGQSPYLINTGVFYQHPKWNLNIAALYNRIGKRIIGVGRTVGTSGDQTSTIPNSYEMPHDAIDLSVSKKIGGFEIKAGVRDLLAQRVNFKQFGNATNSAGDNIKYEEVTKSYKPGRNFNMSVTYSF
ncbi:outer membrane beta-barrel protein [Bacteroidaceae bacterium HV4-6-C5C]|nr:outer membrane beta-barrel protein [Bacteroidaceae bacterium HV4-6-C5C]